jgi:hypothetical protein
VIDDAGIQQQLNNLTSTSANLQELIDNYLSGEFDFDPITGKIAVDVSKIGGLNLDSRLFMDSNQDFGVPMTARVRDSVIIDGSIVSVEGTFSDIFQVNLVGTADVPTVIVESVSGCSLIPISLGGDTTDMDVALGRTQSENLYYIVSVIDLGILPGYGFVDGNNKVVGLAGGSDTWLMTQQDLADAAASGGLRFSTQRKTDIIAPIRERDLQFSSTPAPVTSSTTPAPVTSSPTKQPTKVPTSTPSASPSSRPSVTPSTIPSSSPSDFPSASPSAPPSLTPSASPSSRPSVTPSTIPSSSPSDYPSASPSASPSLTPSASPSSRPSVFPSSLPSAAPTSTPATFSFMAIAVEDDGDQISSSNQFSVTFWIPSPGDDDDPGCGDGPGNSTGVLAPKLPVVEIGVHEGTEDSPITLMVTATPDITDTTDPSISVVISNLPEGTKIKGKYFDNLVTGHWVAHAEDVAAGFIKIHPPADFSGTLDITIEVIAVNGYYLSSTTGEQVVGLYFDPVADGVSIGVSGLGGLEDQGMDFSVSLSASDSDGSETVGPNAYINVGRDDVTLNGDFDVVESGDEDAMIDGVSLEGYFRIAEADLSNLSLQPPVHWHGSFSIIVAGYSIETEDDADGDHLKITQKSFTAQVQAVADAPNIIVPVSVSGLEDTFIPIPNLSAALVDNVIVNGPELLSVFMSGAPEGE